MEVYSQFSDGFGESHLRELTAEEFAALTAWAPAKAFRVNVHPPGTYLDWHPANGRFIITVLSGAIEICVSDGTKLMCGPGTMRLTSDSGKGHTGRAIGDEPCAVLMIDIDIRSDNDAFPIR